MKKIYSIFAFAVVLALTSCGTDASQQEMLSEGYESPLHRVLENGVKSTDDFQILVDNKEFPLNILSEEAIESFKDGLFFDYEGTLRNVNSNVIRTELTLDETKILYQKVLHANITSVENVDENIYPKRNPLMQYEDNPLLRTNAALINGYDPEMVETYYDCLTGVTDCIFLEFLQEEVRN